MLHPPERVVIVADRIGDADDGVLCYTYFPGKRIPYLANQLRKLGSKGGSLSALRPYSQCVGTHIHKNATLAGCQESWY